MAYGGGTVLAMAAQWEWWLLTKSLAQYGLLAIIMAFVLAHHFFEEQS
jgi:hypothetical protein